MKAPTGGYAGGLDCSHSQTALAKGPAAKPTERGERLDPDPQDPGSSGSRSRPVAIIPPPLRPPAKLPICNGSDAAPPGFGRRQKCRSQLRRMPLQPGKYPQVQVFTPRVLWRGVSRPFSYETSTKIPDRQKCRWRPIPVHPKGITKAVFSTGARRPPHMNAPTGGYAGDSAGSNSVAALATPPVTQTYTR